MMTHIGSMPIEQFLAEYWQQRPVLLREVMPAGFDPVSGKALLDIATSEEADSRLIIHDRWPPEVHHGPFDADEFGDLPEESWTILVQEMDRLNPEIARVLDGFRFVANWRVDDAMVSYAAPGGGVGAHTDQYDVFLIQGAGRRRWEICTTPILDPVWREDSDVAVLAEFEPDQQWELNPGDVLYLPPHIAHNGVALAPSITISVGFRAPAPMELLDAALTFAGEERMGGERYLERSPSAVADPGLLTGQVLSDLRSQVRQVLADDSRLNRWIAQRLTEAVRGRVGGSAGSERQPGPVKASSASQLAYYREGDRVVLAASGQTFNLDARHAEALAKLTGTEGLELETVQDEYLRRLLKGLLDQGVLR